MSAHSLLLTEEAVNRASEQNRHNFAEAPKCSQSKSKSQQNKSRWVCYLDHQLPSASHLGEILPERQSTATRRTYGIDSRNSTTTSSSTSNQETIQLHLPDMARQRQSSGRLWHCSLMIIQSRHGILGLPYWLEKCNVDAIGSIGPTTCFVAKVLLTFHLHYMSLQVSQFVNIIIEYFS